jgi:hypothetical protein
MQGKTTKFRKREESAPLVDLSGACQTANAEVTSRSMSSGAAISSWRRRARAVSPQAPSSTKVAIRTPASVTITVRADDGIDLIKTDRSASSATCAVKNLVKRGSISLLYEVLK